MAHAAACFADAFGFERTTDYFVHNTVRSACIGNARPTIRLVHPDVTVVIPTKNRRMLLRRALGTALAQERVSVEVIVVDDGSEDNTANDVRHCEDLDVRLIRHETSRGLPAARNAGIALARAPWVAFLDDDDLWAPDKLVSQLELANQTRDDGSTPAWVCSSCVQVDETDRIMGWASAGDREIDAARLLVDGVVPGGGSGVLARVDDLRRAGLFDENARLYEDWDMWIRLSLLSGGAPSVDRPLVAYRVWTSMSSKVVDLEGAWRNVTDRYAHEATRLGVTTDPLAMHRYRVYRSLHGRQHQQAAEAYRDLARTSGSRKAAALAVAASKAGDPLLSVLSWRNRRRVPSWVRQEAQGWLDTVDSETQRWFGDLEPVS
ncbi:MAG: glycosyltransferase family 2 protein [Acidimicrobiales bacterium]